MWHPIPGLFLPYSPAHRPESLSPERATSLDQTYMPEKAKIGKKIYFATLLLVSLRYRRDWTYNVPNGHYADYSSYIWIVYPQISDIN